MQTTFPEISDRALIDAIRAVAAEYPERVYERTEPDANCRYVHPTKTGLKCGCLLGHAFHRLGVPLDVLALHDESGAELNTVLPMLAPNVGAGGYDFAKRVQTWQDCDEPWGSAVKLVDEFFWNNRKQQPRPLFVPFPFYPVP
ncbi:hypothetical protein ACFC1B_23190 [Streptomyces xiamenensis]|uniref:hypothetical protein n=1 Tax=Streptomyces xiamenensis TaxID=408015 RepID=UPI0035DAA4B5